jgi:hypothetical protein
MMRKKASCLLIAESIVRARYSWLMLFGNPHTFHLSFMNVCGYVLPSMGGSNKAS